MVGKYPFSDHRVSGDPDVTVKKDIVLSVLSLALLSPGNLASGSNSWWPTMTNYVVSTLMYVCMFICMSLQAGAQNVGCM
jgi:hypothetical protein